MSFDITVFNTPVISASFLASTPLINTLKKELCKTAPPSATKIELCKSLDLDLLTHAHAHTCTPAQGTRWELPWAPVWWCAVAAALGLWQLPLLPQHGGGCRGYDAHSIPHPRVQRVLPVVIGHGDHTQGKHLRGQKRRSEKWHIWCERFNLTFFTPILNIHMCFSKVSSRWFIGSVCLPERTHILLLNKCEQTLCPQT